MENYNKSGIRYHYKYYSDDDHGSAPLITEYDGLRFIFDGYKVNLSQLVDNPSLIKQHYKDVSAKLGTEFLPDEDMINGLGYQILQGDTAKAIEIFQVNVDLYPQSYNVWDSMAEALMAKGDYKKAIAYYEKSLALNPKNENANVMIKKMKEKEKKN